MIYTETEDFNRVNVAKTYEIVTPESAEHGDAEERGYVFESESWTVREVVKWLRDYGAEFSSFPLESPAFPLSCAAAAYTWVSGHPSTDYRTAAEETESLHLAHNPRGRMRRRWRYALRQAAKAVR